MTGLRKEDYTSKDCFTTIGEYLWELKPENYVEVMNSLGSKATKVKVVKEDNE
jgi:hypothetical protein